MPDLLIHFSPFFYQSPSKREKCFGSGKEKENSVRPKIESHRIRFPEKKNSRNIPIFFRSLGFGSISDGSKNLESSLLKRMLEIVFVGSMKKNPIEEIPSQPKETSMKLTEHQLDIVPTSVGAMVTASACK